MKDIDRQIAEKIMGWIPNEDGDWNTKDGHWCGYYNHEWHPSTNITQALQAMEEIINDTLWFQLTAVHGRGYEVTIFKAGLGKRTKHSLKNELVTEFENTVSLAICKAALETMEKL